MEEEVPGLSFSFAEAAPELDDSQKALRDKFVIQYLVDFDPLAAAIRVGFAKSYAKEYAEQFMDETYVRNKIVQMQMSKAFEPRVEEDETKRKIRTMLMREAQDYGPGSSHSARVAALGKLMSLYGMDAPVKSAVEHSMRGGVMRIPATPSLNDWEEAAIDSQTKLAEDVRH